LEKPHYFQLDRQLPPPFFTLINIERYREGDTEQQQGDTSVYQADRYPGNF